MDRRDFIKKATMAAACAAALMMTSLTTPAQTFRLNGDGYFNAGGKIVTALCYPDSSRHLTGFNPMVYPDWHVNYTVTVEPQGKGILVTVDLDNPVPDFLLGKVGFNLEFFPGELFGKPWLMDQQSGIICSTLRQYAMLGDAAAMTDGINGNTDDRWIFTEDNPGHALSTAAQLAGAARTLRGFNTPLAQECLDIASELYNQTQVNERMAGMKLQAAVELYLSTGEAEYLDFILAQQDAIVKNIARTGWFTAHIAKLLEAKSQAKGISSHDRKTYRLNRADWSYIPGGVVSGTALIRPDFPELLEFPFLWQQTEYVLGGGSSHYMFLVLAAIDFQ